MSGTTQTTKYPRVPDEVEQEKDIVEEIKKLTPLSLKLKGFALNYHSLQLKEFGAQEEDEIETLNAQTQKGFQQNLQAINDLINGTRQPTDAELQALDQYLSEEEKAKKSELLANLKPIPNYWATVLQNDALIKSHINESDGEVLNHLTRIEYKYSEDAATPHNFTITMHFAPNDFFENEVLTVLLHLQAPRDITKTEGTEIKWKAGKDTTKKQVTKKQKNKKTGQTRTVTKEETVPSFFKLFNSIIAPEEDKELDEEEEEIQNNILDQVDIAYFLVEEAIPFSLEYFLGVRKDYLGEEDGDFEDDEDDDDDEDDEEEVKPKGKGAKGGKGGKPAAGGAEGKQECKQQ